MDKDEELAELRRLVEEVRDVRGRVRPRGDLKERLLRYAVGRRAAGSTTASLEQELGLGGATLERWFREAKRPGGGLSRVVVAAPESSSSSSRVMVRGPRGLVAEGMTASMVAELWRALEL